MKSGDRNITSVNFGNIVVHSPKNANPNSIMYRKPLRLANKNDRKDMIMIPEVIIQIIGQPEKQCIIGIRLNITPEHTNKLSAADFLHAGKPGPSLNRSDYISLKIRSYDSTIKDFRERRVQIMVSPKVIGKGGFRMCKSGKMIIGGDTIPIAVKTFNVKGKRMLDTRSIELQSEAESYAKTASIVADITEKFNIKSPKSLNLRYFM